MKIKNLSLAIALMGGIPGVALASGYHFGSQSVSAQGTAFASAAEADDASTIFYNPVLQSGWHVAPEGQQLFRRPDRGDSEFGLHGQRFGQLSESSHRR